ncbi:hypothetical protein [Priestia megaterium]|uniref:hypothetical protein n=1 Tax=Priestia megaterium TaxID=1404 RepID=UPI000BFB4B4D|nr:hypothetical protein [Priestia megaterium]PGQ88212.1 hypothetical protein COA18_04615 [Priestia megaterium]
MIPFGVMDSKKLGLPIIPVEDTKFKKVSFRLSGGLEMVDNNEICIKRAVVQLMTVQGLRAAHIFHYKSGEVDWYRFEPSLCSLNQAEINGHMIFAIQAMKAGEMTPCFQIESIKKPLVKQTSQIIKFLNGFQVTDRIFVVLVFKDRIFATGNYFDESTLCKAIVDFEPLPVVEGIKWPAPDRDLRLFSKSSVLKKPVIRIVKQYNKKGV